MNEGVVLDDFTIGVPEPIGTAGPLGDFIVAALLALIDYLGKRAIIWAESLF